MGPAPVEGGEEMTETTAWLLPPEASVATAVTVLAPGARSTCCDQLPSSATMVSTPSTVSDSTPTLSVAVPVARTEPDATTAPSAGELIVTAGVAAPSSTRCASACTVSRLKPAAYVCAMTFDPEAGIATSYWSSNPVSRRTRRGWGPSCR